MVKRPTGRIPTEPSAPIHAIPANAVDCHLHMFGGVEEFARDPRRLEDPAAGDLATWVSKLQRHMSIVGLSRAVLVQSVVYREDNAVTIAALERLGTRTFRGVGLVRPDATLQALHRLSSQGIRGIRVNFRHAGALDLDGLRALAPKMADAGMHVQVLGSSPAQLDGIAERLASLPIPVVLDHHAAVRTCEPDGFGPQFLRWFEAGRFFVKLSASYRNSEPPYHDLVPLARRLIGMRPDRLVWGSDWPYVMFTGAPPDAGLLLDALAKACDTPEQLHQILVRTPEMLYGFERAVGETGNGCLRETQIKSTLTIPAA